MRRQAVKNEADSLIKDFGDGAYERACEAQRAARRRRNVRLEKYFAMVALEIVRRCGGDAGFNAVSKYPETRTRSTLRGGA
jgi:hypothetical protein